MTDHLYRVRVIAFPEGSTKTVNYPGDEEPDHRVPVPGWTPPGWKPEGDYIRLVGTAQFVWPSTRQVYRSRSTAKRRAELLESLGATVVIERSNKIVWPERPVDEAIELVTVRPQKAVRRNAPEEVERLDEFTVSRLRRRLESHQ
ncbi:hypothetical protein A5792_19865 [Mycolicibacterium peregrinum]|uniref:Uncharacterized protein n=2 Tax=Mycolicibacterium TaxID=1866885 RepID=A0A1A0R5M9_MYCPR|nr:MULTISPECIES: hypothetical protein [Mycolicibacterium]OBB29074.1 hypothetical protein A5792_19865 [Mycolicibacterium peregrinum]BBX25398.1 hypothetical protein MALV_05230 [Mycolicibacterium alvei]